MIIQPLKHKKTGQPYTNVELTKIFYDKLCNMRDGVGAVNEKQKEKMQQDFYRICNGSQDAEQTMSFMKQIVDTQDEAMAQKLFSTGLLAVK